MATQSNRTFKPALSLPYHSQNLTETMGLCFVYSGQQEWGPYLVTSLSAGHLALCDVDLPLEKHAQVSILLQLSGKRRWLRLVGRVTGTPGMRDASLALRLEFCPPAIEDMLHRYAVARLERQHDESPLVILPKPRRQILFVDDEPAILQSIEASLHRSLRDWEMSWATGGAEALHQIESRHFDVVVTDLMMPGVTGLDVLRRLATTEPETKRIVLSGHEEAEARQLANVMLLKPFSAKALLHASLAA